jgi:integrase
MAKEKSYTTCQYVGTLSSIINDYVTEKRATGLLFNTEANKLSEFSRLTVEQNLSTNSLPEYIVALWTARRPNDSDKTVFYRYSIIKGLAEYMCRMGYSAYIPLPGDMPKLTFNTYVPHIFTNDELCRFFGALESETEFRRMYEARLQKMISVIFRLMYCCGLRLSETTSLKHEDIIWRESTLVIKGSKFNKTRYTPMSEEMANALKSYVAESGTDDEWLFPGQYGQMLGESTIYGQFRKALQKAGIPHGGRGQGPRIHDFRHTFAVHCLQKWIRSDVPLSSALPRLTVYFGHKDMSATEKYLRMTAEVYPEISETLSKAYGHLIPKMEAPV